MGKRFNVGLNVNASLLRLNLTAHKNNVSPYNLFVHRYLRKLPIRKKHIQDKQNRKIKQIF